MPSLLYRTLDPTFGHLDRESACSTRATTRQEHRAMIWRMDVGKATPLLNSAILFLFAISLFICMFLLILVLPSFYFHFDVILQQP